MRILRREVSCPSRKDAFRLYFLTDLHIGARACDENQLASDVADIKRERAFWIGGGDYIDAITRKGDRRHVERNYAEWLWGQDDIIELQLQRCYELLDPIADLCVGLLCGNHERAVLRHYDRDAYAAIVRRLAEQSHRQPEEFSLGSAGFVELKFRRLQTSWKVTVYCHHGYSGGRLKGAKALNLERILTHVHADIVLMGHVHDLVFLPKVVIDPKGQHMTRFGAFVPGYLRTHEPGLETYAEDHGYFPTVRGTFPIEIVPDKRQITFLLQNIQR